jgi:DedD protein
MRGVFDDEEVEEPKPTQDAELTLGGGTLLLIVLGLVLVCGVCFGAGYLVGHRSLQLAPAAAAADGAQPGLQANGSLSKPSATSQPSIPPLSQDTPPQDNSSQPGTTDLPQSAATVTIPVAASQTPAPAPSSPPQPHSPQPQVRPAQPQVHPALPPQTSAPANAPTTSASNVHPAVPTAVPLMVQIAAISHKEDAQVLADALRKRGYAITARREPADNLIHVRIGPFNNRDEANRWRLKLLADGYNAIVQP